MKILQFVTMLLVVLNLFSCDNLGSSFGNPPGTLQPGETQAGDIENPGVTTPDTDDSSDIISNLSFENEVSIDLTNKTFSIANGSAQSFVSTENTESISVIEGITISDTDGLTITSSVESVIKYILTGDLTGSIKINSENDFAVELNNTSITTNSDFADSKASIIFQEESKAFVILSDGTQNTITENNGNAKAAILSNGIVVFSGNGELTVNANTKHGIQVENYIRITSGTITVNSFARDCIRTTNRFIFDDGILTLRGTGTSIDDESKGIKVDGDESEQGKGLGDIIINGGSIDIETIGKAITASFDTDEDGDTTSTTYDPAATVTINNGTIKIKTTGTPYEYTDSNGNEVSLSPEGIEGKGGLTINGGSIYIETTDDCLNVSQYKPLTINAGEIYCHSSSNDSIDSNGPIFINGGTLISIATNDPECAFDCDTNEFTITGGTIVGIGTNNYSQPTTTTTTQNTIVVSSSVITAKATFALLDNSGNPVFAYTIPETYNIMILSSPNFSDGQTYTIKNNVTSVDGENFNGLYTKINSITGGTTSSTTATLSSKVTYLGNTTSNGTQEGGGKPR